MNSLHKKTAKTITPLSFGYYFIPMLIIAALGFADTVYLVISHYRIYTDIGYKSFCAVSRAINCDTVSESPYSIFLGIPVPEWGLLGYAAILFLIGLAGTAKAQKKYLWPIIFWVALLFSMISILLAGVSEFLIHSYCIMCIFSYLVNFFLVFYAWFINRRFNTVSVFRGILPDLKFLFVHKKIVFPAIAIFMIAVFSLKMWLPQYWQLTPPQLTETMHQGVTKDGNPWIGAEKPKIVITEFSDYLCFSCRKFHYYLRQIMMENPGVIRLVHRNFPMDSKINPLVNSPFHEGSANLAILALYAQQHHKFWEMNDLLYQLNFRSIHGLNIKKLADRVGLNGEDAVYCRRDPKLWLKLRQDIAAGLKLGITGTPAFLVNGKVYQGYIPASIIDQALK